MDASLRKRTYPSGKVVYVIEYRIGGKSKRKTLGSIDKRSADVYFRKFCADIAEQEVGLKKVQKISLSDYTDMYLKFAKAEKSPKTVIKDEQVLQDLIHYFGDINLDNITQRELYNFRLQQLKNVSATTVNITFRHLKAIFNRAIKDGYLISNPFVGIKPLRVPESELPRFFDLDEITIVRDAFRGDEFENLIEFYLLTGVRLREALLLNRSDIDFKRKQLVIRSENTKAKKNRVISFVSDVKLEALLKKLPRRKDGLMFGPKDRPQWTEGWVSHKISKTLSKFGFEWASCHTFRHTYISHLVMQGVPLPTVQQIVGHGDYTTTLKYAHLAPNHTIEMVSKRPY